MPRAFFLGAGASKANQFPLDRELVGALGAYLGDRERGKELRSFLGQSFGVDPAHLRDAGKLWARHYARPSSSEVVPLPPPELPDLTDILSVLDIVLAEEGAFSARGKRDALGNATLRKAREQVAIALAKGFNDLHKARKLPRRDRASPIHAFVEALGKKDVILTTNWDILLDEARHARFGATPWDYGTDAELDTRPKMDPRPRLLKLHGSLNWLYCPGCTSLRINVEETMAHNGYDRRPTKRGMCDCGIPLAAVLVTPTFLKSYRNRHLTNVWTNAQTALSECSEWVFIGYSLRPEDIHIKTLLLKAKQARLAKSEPLEVTVVDRKDDEKGLRLRYRRLFGSGTPISFHGDGFGKYVKRLQPRPKAGAPTRPAPRSRRPRR